MKPIPFDPATDIAPIPFDPRHQELARTMKTGGLKWTPHVGCFAWDPDQTIAAESPFPLRIYFILSLSRFIGIFGTSAAIIENLVWLPTWHQARLLAEHLAVAPDKIAGIWSSGSPRTPGEELLDIYRLILEAL